MKQPCPSCGYRYFSPSPHAQNRSNCDNCGCEVITDHKIHLIEQLQEEIARLRESLSRYPCLCASSLDDVIEKYPHMKCFRCKALSQEGGG